ncbi:MAG: NACHT domain-containing protein, partial [Chitinophagaceae bacterium]
MLDTTNLDTLKQLILIKTGLNIISPSDCKAISLSIQKELNKNISETTIKRLFGFATSNTNFSKFTVNTLTEFVSKPDENKVTTNVSSISNDIKDIAVNSRQITNTTLKNIRSRCSVPYELTIPRKFANFDFHYFYESDYSFTAFVAQPGYGKTILLSHLARNIMEEKESKHLNDVVCFFSAKDIFEPNSDNSLEENIKAKIGLTPAVDFLSYFEQQYQKSNTKLILIFDGFAEMVLNRYSKIRVFDRIIDLIATIDQSNAIKIVLAMRPTIWYRFFERIRHAYFLKSKWFPGSYYYLDYNSNVPPLSEQELE